MLDGHLNICKKCTLKRVKKYSRTKKGLVNTIYNHQKHKSKLRGHLPPEYTKRELRDWLFSQPLFHKLFADWEASNYNIRCTPSVDRIDSGKHYLFGNIQLMTWGDNDLKGRSER